MRRAFLLWMVISALVARADVSSEPWPRSIRDFPADLPSTLTEGEFRITITEPRDPQMRTLGGSGGPMLAFTVRNQKSGWTTTFYDQSVSTRLLSPFASHPQLEIWGRGGGGLWSRCLTRFVRGEYRCVRIDEFTSSRERATKPSITTTLPLSGDTLYFVETRIPDESGGQLPNDNK